MTQASHRDLRLLLWSAAALASACGGAKARQFPGAPLVLISIDTLRADHLPVYGYRGVETPNIDSLRKDAILFENAFSHCPLTLPSHVSILTGLLPPQHGVRDNLGYSYDAKAHPGLAFMLKARGYATGAAVSAYVLRSETGLSDSFDFYDSEVHVPRGSESAAFARRRGDDTELRAEKWLDGVSQQSIFFFFHIYEPHLPYDPPEPFKSRYALAYDSEIATADAIVGRLLDSLKRRGIYKRSLVVLLSDHGEGLGDHGEADHGILLYREVLRVPLLMKLPGSLRAGETIERSVGLIDLVPTVAEVLRLGTKAPFPGSSLLGSEEGQHRIYGETFYPRIHLGWSELRSLIDKRDHFIDAPRPELYDMRTDAAERTNRFEGEEALARSMRDEVRHLGGAFQKPTPTDPETLEKLRSIGYLGGFAEAEPSSVLPDPKEHIRDIGDINTAFALAAVGRNEEALVALRALTRRNPRIFDVRFKEGEVLLALGRPREALEALKAAVAISPSLATGVAPYLARAQIDLDNLTDAEASATIVLKDNPTKGHAFLAEIALKRNDLSSAEREAAWLSGTAATALDGALAEAEVRVRQERFQEALAILERARKTSPPTLNLEFLRGDSLARLNRLPEAEIAFRAEIKEFPLNSQAFARLAIVCALQRRNSLEVGAILEGMERANPGASTELLAAKTLDSLGDRVNAARWRHRAEATTSAAQRLPRQ